MISRAFAILLLTGGIWANFSFGEDAGHLSMKFDGSRRAAPPKLSSGVPVEGPRAQRFISMVSVDARTERSVWFDLAKSSPDQKYLVQWQNMPNPVSDHMALHEGRTVWVFRDRVGHFQFSHNNTRLIFLSGSRRYCLSLNDSVLTHRFSLTAVFFGAWNLCRGALRASR